MPVKDCPEVKLGDSLYIFYGASNKNNRVLGVVRAFVDNSVYVLHNEANKRYSFYSLKVMKHHIKQGYLMRLD